MPMQELANLSATDSAAAIDAFLAKYSKSRPVMAGRTASPVLRINTPQVRIRLGRGLAFKAYFNLFGLNPLNSGAHRAPGLGV